MQVKKQQSEPDMKQWTSSKLGKEYVILLILYYILTYSFPNLELVHCFMSGSDCCFLTCIQVFQEAGQMVCYYCLLKNFPQFVVIHTVKVFSIVDEAKGDVFLEFFVFFYESTDGQLNLWFLCLF